MTEEQPLTGRSVLVITDDVIGPAMAGPAIRAVELARALGREGATVVVAGPHPAPLSAPVGLEGVRVDAADGRAALEAMVEAADVVVGFSAVLARHPWMAEADAMVVVDAYDPGLLETLERFRGAPVNEQRTWVADASAHMVEPLEWADAVLVASARQRALVLGVLLALGRLTGRLVADDPALERFCAVVPFGLPDASPQPGAEPPLRTPAGPFAARHHVALWGGGLYDWLDPVTLVEAVARCSQDSVVAAFLAGPHPTPVVGRPTALVRAVERARHHGLLGTKVWFADRWVPYAERSAWLLDADVGVSLHGHHLETEFAFRTRILDYLWAGLPIVCSSGDVLAELVAAHDLGWVVPPGDVDAVAAALAASVVATDADRDTRRRRAAEVAARHTWPEVTRPLVELCRRPAVAPDRRRGAESRSGRQVLDDVLTALRGSRSLRARAERHHRGSTAG